MKKILLLDTSIGTSNMGDHIIMECVEKELEPLLKPNFVYHMTTHLPAFSSLAVLINSLAVQNYASCDLKFAGGSNLLVKDLKTHYPQWNINCCNYKPLAGTILVGVGAGAGEETNSYTTKLYRKILNHDYYHSVRDERSKEYVEKVLGLKAINTGCATMWMLTPEFCRTIPTKKADRVVFTLNGRRDGEPVLSSDQSLIDILQRNYKTVYFWVQGDLDLQYFNRFKGTEGIKIIPPSKDAYDSLLSEDNIDYVGTRLHGGIYAMRHGKRAIIVTVDERASAINESNDLNCISRDAIESDLESYICSEFSTAVKMPLDRIEEWKSQFGI